MVMEEAATPIYHGCPKGQHKESLVPISLLRPGEMVCMKQLSICLMSSQLSVLHTHMEDNFVVMVLLQLF